MNVAVPWKDVNPNIVDPVRNTGHQYLKFINSEVFSEEARHFLRYGYYTNAPYGSKDYNDYWDEQEKRCLEGYSVGGVRITGRHYYFLNFTLMKARPINPDTGVESDNAAKILTFPRFIDHQYYLAHILEECMAEGVHSGKKKEGLIYLKSRRKGLTYFISDAVFGYNFNFTPASTNILTAYEKQHFKVTLDAIHFGLNHINKTTDWAKRRQKLNKRDHFRASFVYKDDNGVEIEDGYMSEVIAISFKDNPFKGIGECFSPNQLVINSLGESVRIDSLKVGDKLLGPDGTERFVLNVHVGKDLMTTYQQRRGVDFTVNTKHLMYGKLHGEIFKTSSEEFLASSKYVQKDFRTIKSSGFDLGKEDIGIDPYFYGLWLGDGSKHDLSIASSDIEVEKYLEGFAKKYNLRLSKDVISENNKAFNYNLYGKKGNYKIICFRENGEYKEITGFKKFSDTYGLSEVSWKWICRNKDSERAQKAFKKRNLEFIELKRNHGSYPLRWLNENNLIGNKHVIPKLKFVSRKDKLQFLAGLIDSDGNVTLTKKMFSIAQTNKQLLKDVEFICRSVGFYTSVNTYTRKSGLGRVLRDGSKLSICGDVWNIPTKIERKKLYPSERVVPALESSIKKVNQYYGDYVGVEVDGDNLFLLDDFTIVHNSATIFGVEEAGKFHNLMEAYAISEPLFRDGDIMTGIPIIWGTGGDMEGGTKDFADMFYNPKAYGLKSFENIYEENAVGDCGYFLDDMWYYPGKHITKVFFNGKMREETVDMLDSNGNSIRDVAEQSLDLKREVRKKGNKYAYLKFISQQPKTPSEALLRTQGTIFDVIRAQARLAQIQTSPAIYLDSIFRVTLNPNPETGEIKPERDDKNEPLYEFPLKDNKNKPGIIEIYEMPIRNGEGVVMSGRYIFGLDSYDDDASETNSVGSLIGIDRLTDRIVCHYKGRPMSNVFYENCRRILKFYNGVANYERRNKGIYGYFYNNNCLHLLCDEPEILKEKGISKANTVGNNVKGTAPSMQVNTYARDLALIWMSQQAYGEEEGSEKTNLDLIRSVPLLKEIIAWNPDFGNYDDVSALGMLMILREEKMKLKVHTVERMTTMATQNYWFKNFNNSYTTSLNTFPGLIKTN